MSASSTVKLLQQILTSPAMRVALGLLASICLPALSRCFFILNALRWEMSFTIPFGVHTLPTREMLMSVLPSTARLFTTDDCAICKDECKDGIILSCGHVYCRACIGRWFDAGNNYCPLDFRVLHKRSLQDNGDIPIMRRIQVLFMINIAALCLVSQGMMLRINTAAYGRFDAASIAPHLGTRHPLDGSWADVYASTIGSVVVGTELGSIGCLVMMSRLRWSGHLRWWDFTGRWNPPFFFYLVLLPLLLQKLWHTEVALKMMA